MTAPVRRALAATALGLWLSLAAGGASAAEPTAWSTPSDSAIRDILVQRIDKQHRGVGIVVGVIDAHGRRVVAYGASDTGDPRPLNGETMFEIGSITKVFTSLVLADMTEHGELALNDPAAKYLPPTVALPTRGGKVITLIDLATHTSGLPSMPDNFAPKDATNPYADYTVDQLYGFLRGYALTRDIGARYQYSNLAVGLLGQILARRAGEDYESLVRQRITGPLGMASTAIALTPDMKARMAVGHDESLKPVANWDLPTLAGAGALRSDADDLLTFLAAELGYAETPLKTAMRAQIVPRRPTDTPGLQVALGWHIETPRTPPGAEVIWHNGGTGGYRTFMGFEPSTGVGVVVLTNVSNEVGGDDIGFHILTGAPLSAPVEHHAIPMEAKALERFVGVYALTPDITITVIRDGDHLFGRVTGQSAEEMFPEAPTGFFFKVVDAQITFTLAPDGAVTGLVLHQAGRDLPAKKT